MRQRGFPLAIALALLASACSPPAYQVSMAGKPPETPLAASPGRWAPLGVRDLTAFSVPPPPATGSARFRAELDELAALQRRRREADCRAVATWNAPAAPLPWSEKTVRLISESELTPPRIARALTLVHVAMHDATAAAWRAKGLHARPRPRHFDPALQPLAGDEGVSTYPSEHAAIAGAAATALAYVFPAKAAQFRADARKAAETRLYAGIHFRSDNADGQVLGKRCALFIMGKLQARGAL